MNNLLIKTILCTEDYENHYKLAKLMDLDVNRNMHPIILRAYVISNIDKLYNLNNLNNLHNLNKNEIIDSKNINIVIKNDKD
tara:strand:+ start:261 stop:506 length:246 start_codon:yes stop_codon:yes gene_type:complete